MFNFGIKDIIDIVLMAVFLYYCYRVMKQTRSLNLFFGILLFMAAWIIISKVLEMRLLGSIFDQLINVGAVALIILFQDEIRRFFYSLGSHNRVERLIRKIRRKKENGAEDTRYTKEAIMPIVNACINMSHERVGALLIFQNDIPLGEYTSSNNSQPGERIDARINQLLIENIFFKNSPMHDGAVIIANGRIVAAACVLPVSNDMEMPKHFGLRHRAAKGISKETDALAIVVSEESGVITAAYQDTLMTHITQDKLTEILMKGMF